MNQETEKDLTNKILCYNCDRKIDVSEIEIGTIFKCKQCYTTLIKTDYFKTPRKNLVKKRNKILIYGVAIGILPMPLLMAYVTTRPMEIVSFYIVIDLLMIWSIKYFSLRANDIIFGIVLAELGIFANITRITLNEFSLPKFVSEINDLSFQVYAFLFLAILFIFLGLSRRKRFILK